MARIPGELGIAGAGKPIGILLLSAISVRIGVASLPRGANWTSVGGAGLLAGMGFTVSVLIAELALDQPVLNEAKIAILVASIAAGPVGLFALRQGSRQPTGAALQPVSR